MLPFPNVILYNREINAIFKCMWPSVRVKLVLHLINCPNQFANLNYTVEFLHHVVDNCLIKKFTFQLFL